MFPWQCSFGTLARRRAKSVAVPRDDAVAPILKLLQARHAMQAAEHSPQHIPRSRQLSQQGIDGGSGAMRGHDVIAFQFQQESGVSAVEFGNAGRISKLACIDA